jgi:hypothetical protein
MSDITKIEKIRTGSVEHEINARYWGGNESLKTINGESLFGSGNFDIDHFFQIDSPANNNVFNISKWNPNLNQTLPQTDGSTLTIVNVTSADIDFVGGMSVKYTESNVTTTYTIPVGISSFVLKKYCCVTFVFVGDGQIVPILPTFESAGEADKLSTPRSINGINFDGSANITNYATCTNAAAIREKVVPVTGNFYLGTGSRITVKFTYANSASSPLLNVAGTGAKAIQYRGSALQSNQYWAAGDVVDFVFDGSVWHVIGPINDNVGSSSGTSTDTKVNQTLTSTNSSYPLLFSYTAGKSSTGADEARFSTGLKYNPSTQSLLFPAATSGKSVNIGLGTKPSSSINGLVLYNAGGTMSDADFITICAADVFIRKADGSMGGRITAELNGASSLSRDAGSNWYGTCSSVATASTKVVDLSNVILGEGSRVWINFRNGNTYTGEQVTMSITTANGSSVSTVLDFYNFIGGSGGSVNTAYTAGISMLPGAYEFIYLNSRLKYTGNYVADRAPEILVKSATTGTGAAITFELVKNMHTVFNIGTKPRALELTIPSASETYSCEFTTGAAPMTFRYPSTLKWVNGILPTLEMSTTYHLSIVNNCAAIVAFKANEPT